MFSHRIWTCFISLVAAILLTSCGCGPEISSCNPCLVGEPVPPVCPSPLDCRVQICKEPIICTIPERNRRIAYMTTNGVKIIHVGETITVVLPSDRLFFLDSSNINPCFVPILKVVSEYIFCYEKMSVRINAYTDCLCSERRNLALSQAQAQRVANFLWCHGIDARLLTARGHGPACPIASNSTCLGRIQNRRIEICFRYIPPYITGCD